MYKLWKIDFVLGYTLQYIRVFEFCKHMNICFEDGKGSFSGTRSNQISGTRSSPTWEQGTSLDSPDLKDRISQKTWKLSDNTKIKFTRLQNSSSSMEQYENCFNFITFEN